MAKERERLYEGAPCWFQAGKHRPWKAGTIRKVDKKQGLAIISFEFHTADQLAPISEKGVKNFRDAYRRYGVKSGPIPRLRGRNKPRHVR